MDYALSRVAAIVIGNYDPASTKFTRTDTLQRTAPMTRFVPVTVLAMLLVASRVASAQATGGGTLPSGVTVTFDKLYIHDDGSKDAV